MEKTPKKSEQKNRRFRGDSKKVEKVYRSLLESSSDAIVTCDMEGRIETISKGSERIFGYTEDELIGKKRVSIFSPGQVVLEHVPKWLEIAREKGEFKSETVFVHKDGSPG